MRKYTNPFLERNGSVVDLMTYLKRKEEKHRKQIASRVSGGANVEGEGAEAASAPQAEVVAEEEATEVDVDTRVCPTDPFAYMLTLFDALREQKESGGGSLLVGGNVDELIDALSSVVERIGNSDAVSEERKISVSERFEISKRLVKELEASSYELLAAGNLDAFKYMDDDSFTVMFDSENWHKNKVATAAVVPPKRLLIDIVKQLEGSYEERLLVPVSSGQPSVLLREEAKAFRAAVMGARLDGIPHIAVVGFGCVGGHFVWRDFNGRVYDSSEPHATSQLNQLAFALDKVPDQLQVLSSKYPAMPIGRGISLADSDATWLKDVAHFKNVTNPTLETLLLQDNKPFIVISGSYVDAAAAKASGTIAFEKVLPVHVFNNKTEGSGVLIGVLQEAATDCIPPAADHKGFVFVPASYGVCFPGDVPILLRYSSIGEAVFDLDRAMARALGDLMSIIHRRSSVGSFSLWSKELAALGSELSQKTKSKDLVMYVDDWMDRFLNKGVGIDAGTPHHVASLLKEACEAVGEAYVESRSWKEADAVLKEFDFVISGLHKDHEDGTCTIESHYQNKYYRTRIERSLFSDPYFMAYLNTSDPILASVEEAAKSYGAKRKAAVFDL
jgi:hypothetical protein